MSNIRRYATNDKKIICDRDATEKCQNSDMQGVRFWVEILLCCGSQKQYAIDIGSADSCSIVDISIELNMPRFMSPATCICLYGREQDMNYISLGKEIKRE